MPRNGAGSYSLPSNTWNPAVPDVPILSDDWNATAADLALAITQSVASDGQTTFTARIPFSQGLTLSNGSVSAPSLSAISDTDTGLYFPASGQIAITANGVQVMSATSTGVTFPLAVTFTGNQSVNGTFTVAGATTLNGSVVLGDAAGDVITVNGTTTFVAPVTVPDASFTNAKLANMATARIKGRVTAGTGVTEDLTGTQVTTLLDAVVGATQTVAGTKGVVPAAAAADQYKVLTGAGTFQSGYGRAFGCILTSTDVVGSTPTITGAVNIASVSTITDAGTRRIVTLTFTNALPSTAYAVHVTMNKTSPSGHFTAYGAKTTTTVVVQWDIGPGGDTEISVSGF